jgi:predicted phosphate transport protein (TIGR00153 family)
MEKWFARRRKSKVLDMAYRQMTLAIDTVTELRKAITAASEGEANETKNCVDRLFVVEREIDDLRRAVFEELTRGSLPSKDREDILHLVKRLDVMADFVKDSARTLLVLTQAEIPKEIWGLYVDVAKDLVECASTLRKGIEKLETNKLAEARSLSEKVDQIESEVDEKYLKMKRLLLKHGREIDPAALMMLRDLIESMEQVADGCDDTADYVRILTVARETA